MDSWPTEADALGPRPLYTCHHPLPNPLPLELRYSTQNVHLQLACRCRRVDPFGQTHEGDAETLEFLEQRDLQLISPGRPYAKAIYPA